MELTELWINNYKGFVLRGSVFGIGFNFEWLEVRKSLRFALHLVFIIVLLLVKHRPVILICHLWEVLFCLNMFMIFYSGLGSSFKRLGHVCP